MSRPEDEEGPGTRGSGPPTGGDREPSASERDAASAASADADDRPVPWPQQLYENIWLWAGVALVFWFLSYVVWGMVDLFVLPGG